MPTPVTSSRWDLRKLVRESARGVFAEQRKQNRANAAKTLEELKASGITVYQLSDTPKWREATEVLFVEFGSKSPATKALIVGSVRLPARNRLLKKAHLLAPVLRTCPRLTQALAAVYREDAWNRLWWVPGPRVPIRRMGDAALHLGLFEQPERRRVLQHTVVRFQARRLRLMVTAAIFALLVLLMMLGVPIAASMALTSIMSYLALGGPRPSVSTE